MARSRPYLHQSPPRLTGSGAFPVRDDSGSPLIRMQTLGAATILVGDARLSAAAGTLFSLLVRVACAPGMLLGRDVLLRALWPDQDEVRQRANLRQALYKLRSYGVRIGLHGDVVQLDVSQVIRTFSMERTSSTFEHDVTLGHEPFGAFLAGFAVPWPEYQEWLTTEREAVHADVRRVLAGELHRRRERADWGGADALARWLLQFDPLNEEATLTIAECTALSGSKSEAVAILDRYLAELGPNAGDIRLPATMLRRRIAEPVKRGRLSFAPTERHFVGREEELAELTLAMRRARWHDGSGVLLHGAPGIGKTRLASELEKVAVIEGIRVSSVSCRESDVLRPLSVFVDMLPEWLTHSGALGCDPSSLLALRRLVPTDQRQALFPSLPAEVRDAPIVTSSTVAANSSAGTGVAAGAVSEAVPASYMTREPLPMMSALRRALIDLLSAISDERPILFIIDDVHWIDEHSWDVLTDLVDRAHTMRVFLLITSREAHARPEPPQRTPLALHVRALPPLSPDSCELLTRAIGDDLSAPASDELVTWFSRSSEGNPLFLRALVNHWIETGEAGGVPPTLRGVIEQRLSQLSGDALRVLQTAALLGKWATSERVMGVLELTVKDALHAMDELSKIGALRDACENSLEIPPLLVQAVLESLPAPIRFFIGSRIGKLLSLPPHFPTVNCEAHVVELLVDTCESEAASHFFRNAMKTLLEMDEAHRALALARTVKERVPELLDNEPTAVLFRDVLYSAGQYSRLLRDHLWIDDNFDDLPKWDLEHPQEVVRMVEIADRSMYLGDYLELCCRGLFIAQSPNVDPQLRFRASVAVIRSSAMGLPRDIPDTAFATGSKIALDLPDSEKAMQELLMYFHTPFGDHSISIAAARACVRNAASQSRLPEKVRMLGDCAYAILCAGEINEAEALFIETKSAALKGEILSRVATAIHNISMISIIRGDFDAAEFTANECLDISIQSDDPFLRSLAGRNLTRISLLRGDTAAAQSRYAEATKDLPVSSHPQWNAFDIALKLGIACSTSDMPSISRYLPLAENNFQVLKGTLGQDFLLSRIMMANSITGVRTNSTIYSSYLSKHRRESYPVPHFLAETAVNR